MNFEFDPRKRKANKLKRGIDFEEAKRLWKDDRRVVVIASYPEERRLLIIGKIDGEPWTAIWTERGEAIRIISVRRARREEANFYDSQRT